MSKSLLLTSSDIPRHQRILLLPLGAWEQHGPHLPLATDSIIVDAVISTALAQQPELSQHFVVAPTLPITASDEHEGFPGSLSMGTAALTNAVVAICRSASHWAAGVIIVNGHGGNFDALRDIASALTYEKIQHTVWTLPHYEGGDMHAGHTETSLLLHLLPHSVDTSAIPTDSVNNVDVNVLRSSGVRAVSESGVLGHPATATSQHGVEVLDLYSTSLLNTMQSSSALWLSNTQ